MNESLYKQAKESLTQEQLDDYKQIGEQMYNSIDFTVDNPDSTITEAVAYISESLKSGMHPSYLDNNELNVMKEWGGDTWFTKFGYNTLKLDE